MKFGELVNVADAGIARLRNKAGAFIAGKSWGKEKSVIEVHGWVRTLMRERGKIVPGSRTEGHNVWTDTGREYLAMLMTYQADGSVYRNDKIKYMGVGTGMRVEGPGVSSLAVPATLEAANFLAPIANASTTFPYTPSRTSVRYSVTYTESQLSVTGPVSITELGLFTDGHRSTFAVGGRDITMANAGEQAPVAYKYMAEPIEKTQALQFLVEWEIRY
jgi:hypothetical protein